MGALEDYLLANHPPRVRDGKMHVIPVEDDEALDRIVRYSLLRLREDRTADQSRELARYLAEGGILLPINVMPELIDADARAIHRTAAAELEEALGAPVNLRYGIVQLDMEWHGETGMQSWHLCTLIDVDGHTYSAPKLISAGHPLTKYPKADAAGLNPFSPGQRDAIITAAVQAIPEAAAREGIALEGVMADMPAKFFQPGSLTHHTFVESLGMDPLDVPSHPTYAMPYRAVTAQGEEARTDPRFLYAVTTMVDAWQAAFQQTLRKDRHPPSSVRLHQESLWMQEMVHPLSLPNAIPKEETVCRDLLYAVMTEEIPGVAGEFAPLRIHDAAPETPFLAATSTLSHHEIRAIVDETPLEQVENLLIAAIQTLRIGGYICGDARVASLQERLHERIRSYGESWMTAHPNGL